MQDGPELDAREASRLSRLFGSYWAGDSIPNTSAAPSTTHSREKLFGLSRLRTLVSGSDGDTPLKIPRIIAFSLTVIFGIVSWGIGISFSWVICLNNNRR